MKKLHVASVPPTWTMWLLMCSHENLHWNSFVLTSTSLRKLIPQFCWWEVKNLVFSSRFYKEVKIFLWALLPGTISGICPGLAIRLTGLPNHWLSWTCTWVLEGLWPWIFFMNRFSNINSNLGYATGYSHFLIKFLALHPCILTTF